MSFKDIILIELKKIKRSKLLILILVPPLLVVLSGITNISQYFSSESKEVWSAMFVQSALLFGYYLLPLTMLIVCTVLNGIEQKNNGLNKMFSLPIAKRKIALAKFIVIIIFILIEILTFFVIFSIAGLWITSSYNLNEPIPYIYMFKWSIALILSSLPCVALMWMIVLFFDKVALSIGLNLMLIIPSVLIANTSLKFAYPYCYSGYIVSTELHRLSTNHYATNYFIFLSFGITIFVISNLISIHVFSKKNL